MKTKSLLVALFLASATAGLSGPKIKATAPVSVRDSEFSVVRVLNEPAEIEVLRASFKRAKKVAGSREWNAFAYKIDFESRWLYDAERGEFMLLSKAEQPVFQLSEEDRAAVNALIQKKEPNQRLEPTPTSVTSAADAAAAPAAGAAHH